MMANERNNSMYRIAIFNCLLEILIKLVPHFCSRLI